MFKKVNKFKLPGTHMSSLHTMTNVLCRIYEVFRAKRFKTSHQNGSKKSKVLIY